MPLDATTSYASQHGCAWFEPDKNGRRDPNTCSGWWAVGGSKALRFTHWRELPKGIVWWTNLTREEAWALGRWSTFKSGELFGPDWPALMTESGHGATDEAIANAVQAWSETFARCAEWLADWAYVNTNDKPWDWGEGDLADALASRLGWFSDIPEEPQVIFQAAYSEDVLQEVPSHLLKGRRKVVLAFPRVSYVQKLWGARYPTGPWKEVTQWPHGSEERLAWIRAESRPLLVRISEVTWRLGQETEGSLWLGMRGRRFAAAVMEPFWMTAEEAILLGAYAVLDIDEGFIGHGWTTEDLPPNWAMSSEDPLVSLSWSQALLSAAAWKAAASPTREPNRRKKSAVTARALWWRAADRARCFQAARALHGKGWSVFSYGEGQVTLLIDPTEPVEPLADAIGKAGLLMPALLAKLAPMGASVSHEDWVQVDRWLKRSGGVDRLVDVDRLVATWAGSAAEIRSVLAPVSERLMALAPSAPNAEWGAWWKTVLNQQARRSVDRLKARAQRIG